MSTGRNSGLVWYIKANRTLFVVLNTLSEDSLQPYFVLWSDLNNTSGSLFIGSDRISQSLQVIGWDKAGMKRKLTQAR